MTTSALERRSTSSSRSSWMPSSSRPSPWSGCGRRTLSKRRTSASSVASRKTRLGRSPRSRAAAMASSRACANHPRDAHVDDDGDLLQRGVGVACARLVAQVGEGREQLGRQVVDDEPAEVLEDVGGRRAAGAAHPGDDDDRRVGQRPAWRGRRCRRSFEDFSRREVHGWLRRCTLSQVGRRWPLASEGPMPGTAMMSVGVRLAQALDRTEVPQQRLLPAGPQPGYAVELARRHRLGPALAVEGDGEAVRLVAQALEQVEALARARQDHRVVLARAATPPRGAWRARRGRPPRCRARRAPPAPALTCGSPPSTTTRLGG